MVAECTEQVRKRRLKDEAWLLAMAERWYRSEEAGYNVGERAIRAWIHSHWPGFLRACWIEHMLGHCFWLELKGEEYGILKQDFGERQELVNKMIEKLRCGAENLELICWSRSKSPSEQEYIRQFLHLININDHRLRCAFDDECKLVEDQPIRI